MAQLDHTPRYIQLTQGKVAMVCAHDYERLNQYKWQANKARKVYYASRYRTTSMHREVNNTPSGLHTDHINRDTLDNRCTNLQSVTPAENLLNRTIQKNNTSGTTGVYRWQQGKYQYWAASIGTLNRKNLGYFKTKKEAVLARRIAEKEYGFTNQ